MPRLKRALNRNGTVLSKDSYRGKQSVHQPVDLVLWKAPVGDLPRNVISGWVRISDMERVYDEIINFIASGPSQKEVIEFRPSEELSERVADLLYRRKTTGLTQEEESELQHFLFLEHAMRLAKARAETLVS